MKFNPFNLSNYLVITNKLGNLYGFSCITRNGGRFVVYTENGKWFWRFIKDGNVVFTSKAFEDTFSAIEDAKDSVEFE